MTAMRAYNWFLMEQMPKRYRRCIFAVSDASGNTCRTVIQAALSQFETVQTSLEIIPRVRSRRQVHQVFRRAAKVNGVVVYTMVAPELRQLTSELGRLHAVPTVDVLGPLLTRFSDLLEISPLAKPGLFRELDDEYFRRIEAVDFTIKHDDGLGLSTLDQAEIVLLGVSRTCKTPVSIYLSYRGWKVANIPVIPEMPLPAEVLALGQQRIVCLSMQPARLEMIRKERRIRLHLAEGAEYTDPEYIRREVGLAMRLYAEHGWTVVDVTYKSVEEMATEIMRLIYSRFSEKKGNIREPF